MPELPEMENYKQQLSSRLIGQTITAVQIERSKSINTPSADFCQQVERQTIINIERRAKYLLFNLASEKVLLLHLMLGGKLFFGSEADSPKRTKQVVLSFGEEQLYFIGLRLGFLHILSPTEVEGKLAGIGPEPLSPQFTYEALQKQLEQKQGAIKNALIDQAFIAGIGNRYSDEICFTAEIHPMKKIKTLGDADIVKLFQAIRQVLTEATHYGGYMDMPLYKGDTKTGSYLPYFKVHGKADHPCPRCGAKIIMEKIASKKVYYCPNCQQG
ncbi:DNA-formamidopyrimidine glycosylase [Pullulanibacillus camelliae]|uniref:Formamidopyrimidine-DNA glycosylase n=1 Tax=Pullulanibacillus camelliae TaxID=1707096 RepID=A0A8J2YK01_9BACL|nr:bifunctional DNA-formamidopyrimidine glycosylase/DNA-(apurinic or apyrimidinic site) lyase [Pullulanibacillus camelliae]GGE49651.1 DNA-formamidopyrimidine glycosylase [Pullulanibacillus camelliae]